MESILGWALVGAFVLAGILILLCAVVLAVQRIAERTDTQWEEREEAKQAGRLALGPDTGSTTDPFRKLT